MIIKCIDKLEILSRVTGVVVALIAIFALFLPASMWQLAEAKIAQLYGANGWVYYEVGEARKLTEHGNLHLLKVTETAYYEEISVGDKLRVSGDVSFRSANGTDKPKTFVLINGDCVIVTSQPNNKIEVKKAKSGGWLQVSTSPCGLF
jgi:hypothetical protein